MGLLDSLFPPTNTNWGTILGEAPTYQPNPYVNFYDQNRNKITGALAGLVGSGSDPRAALMGLTQGALQGGQADSVYQQKQADIKQQQDQQNRTVAYLQKVAPQYAQAVQAGAISPTDAYKQYLTDQGGGGGADLSSTTQGRQKLVKQYGLTGTDATNFVLTGKLPGSNQSLKAGLGQPLPFRDAKGHWHAVEPMTDGSAVDLQTQRPPTPDLTYDPFGFAGGKAGSVVDAKTAANARQGLPSAEQAYSLTTKALDSIIGDTPDANVIKGEDEQFGNVLGIPQQALPAWWGSSKADFRNLVDQLSGQAFLQIRQALKGAGQVTDFEGQKGELAVSRMRAAAEKGSKDDFVKALLDYKDAIDNGMRLLRQQASGDYAAGDDTISPSDSGSGGYTILGVE